MQLKAAQGNSFVIVKFIEVKTRVSKKGNEYQVLVVGDSKNFNKQEYFITDECVFEKEFGVRENVCLEVEWRYDNYKFTPIVHKVLINDLPNHLK